MCRFGDSESVGDGGDSEVRRCAVVLVEMVILVVVMVIVVLRDSEGGDGGYACVTVEIHGDIGGGNNEGGRDGVVVGDGKGGDKCRVKEQVCECVCVCLE